MSYTPQGQVDKAGPIELKFDKPAIDESAVGKPAEPDVVSITPAVPWKGFWQDRQTLVVEATAPLAASTRYEVALDGELRQRSGGFRFAFIHHPLAIEGVWGIDAEALPPDGNLPLSFNQPVRPADAAAHCKLVAPTGDIALKATDDKPGANVTLAPAAHLVPGGKYTLSCASLTGVGGNITLDKPYSLALRARPKLAIEKLEPMGTDVSADEVTLTLTFTTPVTLDVVRKAVKSEPRIPHLDEGYLSGDGTQYKVTADLETETDYVVRVKALADIYGQKLAAPADFKFHTGNARPRLSMERGIFALEASAKGYPLWSRNVGKFDIECAQIPQSKLVQILTTDMNYDPWGGNNDDKPIDWKALKVKPTLTHEKTTAKNKWLLHELDLGETCGGTSGARGVYLAEVRSNEVTPDPDRGWLSPRRNRVLANVTDMGVLIKAGTSSGLVWVTSLATGSPVAGAKVSVFKPDGKQVLVDTTNADGIIKIPGSVLMKDQTPSDPEGEGDWDNYRSQRLIAVVEKAGDTAIVDGNWANGIQTWNFGVREDRTGGASKIRGFIQSDRGLYRPGENVHFKGIAREVAMGTPPHVPAKTQVGVEITDSRGQTVMTKQTKLSAFGGFAFDYELPAEASTGDYYVAATIAGQVFRERFSVEEFRPASFELGLRSEATHPKPGDKLVFDLDAKYLFGAPVGDAKVEWGLRKRKHPVHFDSFPEFTFSANPREWWWYEPHDDYGDFVSDGNGTTDAHGKLAISARDSATAFDGPVDYILSANVTDSSDQTMSKSTLVTAHLTSFYLGMHANELVQAVGMPFGINLVALDPDGKQVATKVHLSFIRDVNTCNWSEVGSRSYYHCDSSQNVMIERDIDLAAGGSHTERINPTEPGDYIVRAEAKDAKGRPVIVASEIWVIGKGEAFWSGDEGDRMTVVASKPSYQAGETARLVAQANLVSPTALITIERDGVIDARVKKLASASEGVELPIADAWAPNVFASIAMVSGRHGTGDKNRPMFKMGLVELKVSSEHKQLDVRIALDKDTVRPGDKVSGVIKVTHKGDPVKAEVSLSAADEGVLQLIAYQTPNPMKTFYAPYGLGVDSGTSWNRIARLADPEAGDPDEGGDSASSGDGQRIRSKFVSSAFWAPMLVTNEKGEIPFSFTAPDNLTAFRLMAVAADVGDQFGAGELRLTVNKPLMAAPALPRFLHSDDTASVGVVVHNHTDKAGVAVVVAKATGAVLDGGKQMVTVPANGSARVRWAATASQNAAATFEFAVQLGTEHDAVRVTLPIDRPRVIDDRLLAETTGTTWTGQLGTASDVLRKESTLEITVDKTGLGDLAPGLRALVEYPYGCLEQTMSRFIPLVAAKDLAKSLDDPSLQGTKASAFVRAGIAKVIRHQQGDGLFSLWPQSQTYPHLAAYALWGLTVAQQAGETVPKDVFDRGIAALQNWANNTAKVAPDSDAATLAMAAYVMALRHKPDAALNARLYAMRDALPKWGQAFLLRAMALAKADKDQIADLEKVIADAIKVSDGKAVVRESTPGYEYELYMTSDVRATAMTLAALLEVDPKSPLIDPLAAGLKSERNLHGTWVSTQENLWSLVALAEYAKRATKGDVTTVVKVGGTQVGKKKVSGSELYTMRVPLDGLTDDHVEIANDQPAHITVRVREARVDAGAPAANGFSIQREYEDAATGKSVTTFKAGALVTVRLSIAAKDQHRWVAVVDPLPAGFEVVNPNLAASGGQKQTASSWIDAITWSHQDIRDDRVAWFADTMSAGTFQLTYQARATIDGTFGVLPASVEAMYQPDVRGRTAQTTLTVTP